MFELRKKKKKLTHVLTWFGT